MSKSYFKLTLMLVVYFILVNTFSGCKGKGNEGPQSSATTSKTAIVSKTTSSTFTQAKSSNATASASAQRENTMPADSSANNTENNTANNAADNVPDSDSQTSAGMIVESEDDRFASVETVIGQNDEKKIDMGGKTISIAYWVAGAMPSDAADASALQIALYRRIKAAEQKYNFKADLVLKVDGGNTNVYLRQMVNETLAGVKFADIFMTQSQFSFPAHINSNLILPLDDYINYEDPVNKSNPIMYKGTM